MPRILLYLLVIPLLLVVAAVLLLPLLVDDARLVKLATEELEARSGAQLTVRGDAGLSLFPRIALRLGDAELKLSGEGQREISARELSLDVFLRPLLSQQLVIKGLEVDGLALTLPARKEAEPRAPATGSGAIFGAPLALNVASLRLSDARIILQQPAGAEPVVLELPLLRGTDLNLEGNTASLTLELRMTGERNLSAELASLFTVNPDSQTVNLQTLEIELTGATPEPMTLDATGSVRLADTGIDMQLAGAIKGAHSIENLRLRLRTEAGAVRLETISGVIHGGQLEASATLTTHPSTPTLSTRGALTGLDTAMLLAALKRDPMLSGRADARWQLNSQGDSRNAVIAALEGEIQLDTEALALEQIGVESMLCQVIAQVNQEPLQNPLPARSSFINASASIRLAAGEARLNPLLADLAHVGLRGDGSLDLLSSDFVASFKARLAPTLAELDPACRVNERLVAIDWPVNCRGQLGAKPGDWCKVDSEAILADLARREIQSKVREEGGRLLQRLLQRNKPANDNP